VELEPVTFRLKARWSHGYDRFVRDAREKHQITTAKNLVAGTELEPVIFRL